ncbi:MAG: Stk1 family PASTA domain-containing Ser/Thr kinase [Propionibacteriaceae bacterium]|jgi:serine/threonine-protein kinase|nr:Stk1 family PASTA domain-containing Ser/Thr kinase [Propionibacteriaceae bacterium]
MTDEPRLLGGRYQLGALLGRGGMAEVRHARDTRLNRDVAVKQLRVDLATDPTFQERFRREAQAAAGLNHPNIVAVYDTGEEPDPATGVRVPYIVMELVEGHTLREILRTGRQIQPRKALEFTEGVLEALNYSHRAGIIHRDIKPANVMLTPDGSVKVMDFGIARAVADTSATMTQTAAVIGTAQYLSPEQARGEPVDARSDIYSAGCLLYELLVGRPPFTGDSPVSVAYQHVRELPIPPSQIDPMITGGMDTVVLKALAKNPVDRYQSAAMMRDDIARLLAGQDVYTQVPVTAPTVAVPAPVPEVGYEEDDYEDDRSGKWRVGIMVFLIALVVIGVGLGAFFLLNPGGRPALVTVPEVVGYTPEQSLQILQNAKLVPVPANVRGPDNDSVGRVVSQNPFAGTEVPEGSEVRYEINLGPEKDTVLSGLVGMKCEDAQAQLKAIGFTNVNIQEDSDEPITAKKGQVTRVNPAEGAEIPVGQEVIIYCATGKSEVPMLTGVSEERAEWDAKNAGFKVEFTQEVSESTPGNVIGQDPLPGTMWDRTKPIKLVVAKAPPSPPPTSPPPSSPPPSSPEVTP